jgi:hypothetical protein
MNWHHIEQLLANCSKQSRLAPDMADQRLRDYAEFLARYDGAEGFLCSDNYIVLWSALQICELNFAYRIADFVPAVILFGTDGGDTVYGIDEATGRYVSLPLIGMSNETLRDEGASFEEFLENRVTPQP